VAEDAFWEFERAGWERAAERYEELWLQDTGVFVEPLLDAAAVGAGSRLLDVACGPGYVSEAAMARGAAPTGLDVAEAMVARARSRLPQAEFLVGDAQQLPLANASFDAVTCNFGVLHFSQPHLAFAEACRVLVPGGRLAFTVWTAEGNSVDEIVGAALDAHAIEAAVPEGPEFYRYADPDRCRRDLTAAGFDATSVETVRVEALWRLPAATQLFEAELHAGVRTAAVLAAQPPDRLEAIRDALEAGVERYADGDGFALPIAAVVVSAAT
jgi:ubiquinone/menaquinone biosynthesis C-methylase UbiE